MKTYVVECQQTIPYRALVKAKDKAHARELAEKAYCSYYDDGRAYPKGVLDFDGPNSGNIDHEVVSVNVYKP